MTDSFEQAARIEVGYDIEKHCISMIWILLNILKDNQSEQVLVWKH